MAEKKVSAKDETMAHISWLESSPEVWDSRHRHYKNRENRNIWWQSMVEALNASTTEVNEKYITSATR